MARLYSNENFPLPVVQELRRMGHDVVTIQETGRDNQAMTDEAVLAFAADSDRAVLTLNRRHFVRLHAKRPEHAGIIVCSFDTDFARQARLVHEAIESSGQLQGLLVRVNRPAAEEPAN